MHGILPHTVCSTRKLQTELHASTDLTCSFVRRLAASLGSSLAAELAASFKVLPNEKSGLTVLESCLSPGNFVVAEWDGGKKTYSLKMQVVK